MKIFMSASFFRFGLVGIVGTLFNDRERLPCDEVYCHYRDPELVMFDMGMAGGKPRNQVYILILYTAVFRVLAFFALKYRMSSEMKNKIVHFVAKTVKKAK